ncbi:phosphodiester glycosidase family protein [Streptomyces sp. NPDC012769]|uniref:phosphodiester glycosidase family protein n=1 Tax=Streptomyces sp. NPDC012769 TaxID=3364848 RepID=UPI0036BB0806
MMKRSGPLWAVTAALTTIVVLAVPGNGTAVAEGPAVRMPLGPDELITQPSAPQTLAPGVTYQKFTQGYSSDRWTVWVRDSEQGPETIASWEEATAFAKDVTDEGYTDVSVVTFDVPAAADTPAGRVGYGVRVGSFAPGDRASADALQSRLAAAGHPGRVLYTAEDGAPSTGPWQVRVVRVQPTANVKLEAVHGKDVSTSETVRAMADAAGALVAVNGSEFDISKPGAPAPYEGIPQGLYVRNSVMLGAANNGRTALLLDGAGARARITEVTTEIKVTADDGATNKVDGVNRLPGTILGCGGGPEAELQGRDTRLVSGTATATELPWRNVTCSDTDEIVLFRPQWGPETPRPAAGVDSVEAVVTAGWEVLEIRPAGGPIPPGTSVFQGIGEHADWLRSHAKEGRPLKPSSTIKDAQGNSVWSPTLAAVAGGGPALVRDGEIRINTAANGMTQFSCGDLDSRTPCRPNNTLLQRHPRTLAGVGSSGELILVTIDGRYEGYSVGATWTEAAQVMKWLGAVDAVGLGSGGDTTLMIGGTLYNRPMDLWGTTHRERPMSNAVAIVPR